MTRRFDLGGSFGVMQGRLSSQTSHGYQAFPWETWEQEFDAAADRGLEHIEWIVDSTGFDQNPLIRDISAVERQIGETGVQVVSVCADYLMDRPLAVQDDDGWQRVRAVLRCMNQLGAKWLVIPCVDQSSIRIQGAYTRFVEACSQLGDLASESGVHVSIEADLDPKAFNKLLVNLDPMSFGVNYDVGNSAYLGYGLEMEFSSYGHRISLVHIKDRVEGGASTPLFTGDADIGGLCKKLVETNFSGPVTMQAYRDRQGIQALDDQLASMETVIKGVTS